MMDIKELIDHAAECGGTSDFVRERVRELFPLGSRFALTKGSRTYVVEVVDNRHPSDPFHIAVEMANGGVTVLRANLPYTYSRTLPAA